MPQLLILSRHAVEYQRCLEAASLPALELVVAESVAEALTRGAHCEVVFGEPDWLAQALPHLPQVRWMQATWAGVEPLLNPALRRDYVLTNARGVFGRWMAEYVFAYLLAHERHVLARYATQQEKKWDMTPPGTLRGKHLGLMGVGSIGAEIARTAKHFGMQVRGYTRASEDCAEVDVYYHGDQRVPFATGLNYLVAVLPRTSATQHLVDAAVLAALAPQASFINVGRGNAVDEAALLAALSAGHLGGAVLDVFQTEPLPRTHPLWAMPNVLITSHTSALTVPREMAEVFIANYQRFVRGEAVQYQVDFARGY